MKVYLAAKYFFEAAHRLVSSQLDDQSNLEVYGKCSGAGGHGHNYQVELRIEGKINSKSGMLISRKELDVLVEKALLQKVDHTNLNDVIPGIVTTGEMLALQFYEWIEKELPQDLILNRLRLVETPRNRFDVFASKV